MNCKVCKQPIEAHSIKAWGGVAHTLSPDGRECSRLEAERLQFVGEINVLKTVIRSLRWRAGRMRRGGEWTPDDLDAYSDHWLQRLNRYLAIIADYYSW